MTMQTALQSARHCAAKGDFLSFLQTCSDLQRASHDTPEGLLTLGSLFLDYGFLSRARSCFERSRELLPESDPRPLVNLANVARESLDHKESSALYLQLAREHPALASIRRNLLTSLEYDIHATDAERFAAARAWGQWAEQRAGGARARPPLQLPAGRPLRVGYASADFCQHTVGWFIKDVLAAHDPARISAHAYSAGAVQDSTTDSIRSATVFRDVRQLSDQQLAEQIRKDGIDVLVDLSGHTAGSRLSAFAYRPAPVMVSWLGYFATTGLECMDAVLLDAWHAPDGMERFFTERIIRMEKGRLCYTPASFAPSVCTEPPCLRNGYVTFGSFNNTSKLHAEVLELWARVLRAVPESRLLLKWRTFNDQALKNKVWGVFRQAGIARDRVLLRGPSFHKQVLQEYADVDIALDPFPFTGGLTSCEALWMGVPVITLPLTRVVSRQTFAFLSAIGLQEFAASGKDEYVFIAKELAFKYQRLQRLRGSMRECMRTSQLCDVASFTRGFEDTLHNLVQEIYQTDRTIETNMTDSQKITIDGKEYDLDSLSDNAKAQLQNLQFTDQEISRLQNQLAIFQTARTAYANALKQELEQEQ